MKGIKKFRTRYLSLLIDKGCTLIRKESDGFSFWVRNQQTGFATLADLGHALGRYATPEEEYQIKKFGSFVL